MKFAWDLAGVLLFFLQSATNSLSASKFQWMGLTQTNLQNIRDHDDFCYKYTRMIGKFLCSFPMPNRTTFPARICIQSRTRTMLSICDRRRNFIFDLIIKFVNLMKCFPWSPLNDRQRGTYNRCAHPLVRLAVRRISGDGLSLSKIDFYFYK